MTFFQKMLMCFCSWISLSFHISSLFACVASNTSILSIRKLYYKLCCPELPCNFCLCETNDLQYFSGRNLVFCVCFCRFLETHQQVNILQKKPQKMLREVKILPQPNFSKLPKFPELSVFTS